MRQTQQQQPYAAAVEPAEDTPVSRWQIKQALKCAYDQAMQEKRLSGRRSEVGGYKLADYLTRHESACAPLWLVRTLFNGFFEVETSQEFNFMLGAFMDSLHEQLGTSN